MEVIGKDRWRDKIRAIWRRNLRPFWQDFIVLVILAISLYLIIREIIIFLKIPISFKIYKINIHYSPESDKRFWIGIRDLIWNLGVIVGIPKLCLTLFQPQIRWLKLQLTNDHIVVCGMGHKASLCARSFHEDNYKVVLISNDKNTSSLEQIRELGILVLKGDPTDRELLQRARVHKAQYLVAICDNDGDNAEIAINARALVSEAQKSVLTGLVHITDPHLRDLLKEYEIKSQTGSSYRLAFFNLFESGARKLFKEFPPFGEGAGKSPSHLLIVGLGPMGASLTIHASMLWRISPEKSTKKLAITIVDKDADRKKEFFLSRYPQLNDSWELIPVISDTESPQFDQAKFLWNEEGRCIITSAYICLEEDSRSLAAALSLFQHLRRESVPIVVQLDSKAGLATLLQEEDKAGGSFANLHSFGLLDLKWSDLLSTSTNEMLARALHQDYVLKQPNIGESPETNPSLSPWEKLSKEIKESNRREADHIGKKLIAVHCDIMPLTNWDAELFEFTPEEIEILARMEHERWSNERRNEGWTYGPRDNEGKKNPNLVEWDKLTDAAKNYNLNTSRNLPVFLAGAGFQIFRIQPKQQNVPKESINNSGPGGR
ncbi:MAG: RyR domain-containing protein [Desulfobaccales bacterium]